jgi:uncharacterized protein YabN with tetrapyrrole methylase and pyrophosphatase domain
VTFTAAVGCTATNLHWAITRSDGSPLTAAPSICTDIGQVAITTGSEYHVVVYGDAVAATSGEVLTAWDEIKRGEDGRRGGLFGEVPQLLPALLFARKSQRRVSSAGLDPLATLGLAPRDPLPEDDTAAFAALGDDLFVLVDAARRRGLDPELALRATTARLRATANPDPSPDQGPA